MHLNRKKNSIRNIKSGMINKIMTIFFQFLKRTIIIYVLGSEYLGLSSLFTSILEVLSLSELGIGGAMVYELYKPIAVNDTNKIRALQKLYKKIYKTIGLIILLVGIALTPFLGLFINGSYPTDINIYILYIIYILNTASSYLLFSYQSTLLTAYQRRDIITNIATVIHFILYATQIIGIVFFHNYYIYVLALLIFTIIENFVKAIIVNKMFPDYKPDGELDRDEINSIFVRVKSLFGHKLSNVVTNSVDTIVISSFIGLNMVTIYNNYYYILSAISSVLDIIYQSITAGIGNSLVSETREKNIKDFSKFSFINTWLVGWCSICFLCLYQPTIKIWMGADLMLPISSVVLLVIYFYVWKIRQTVLLYKDAAGLWNIDKRKPYIEILCNLLLNILLVNIIGVNGVIISTIVSMLFISFPWETIKFIKIYFNENPKNYFFEFFRNFFIVALIATLTYYLCSFIKFEGILEIIIKFGICCIFPNILALIINLKNDIFWDVLRMFKLNKLLGEKNE